MSIAERREEDVYTDLGYSRPVTGEVPVVKVADTVGEPVVAEQVEIKEAPVTHLDDWRLDEQTIALGRRGIAQSRAAIRAARADHIEYKL